MAARPVKTLHKYVFSSFLSSFALAFLVLTFVLTIGLLVQIVGLMLRGLPMSQVARFICIGFPETLQWTVPLALLVSSVLVFSRLSADSEIAAMRSCGVNLLRVSALPLCFAALCSVLCVYVNFEIVPRAHFMRRNLKSTVNVETAVDLLEPGRNITDFPDVSLYFESKDDATSRILHNVSAYETSDPDNPREVTAEKVQVTQNGADVILVMYNPRVIQRGEKIGRYMKDAVYTQTFTNVLKRTKYFLREKDYRFVGLLEQIDRADAQVEKLKKEGPPAFADEPVSGDKNADGASMQTASELYAKRLKAARKWASELKVEFSKRLVSACASLVFVLLGIPLGMKAQRKESSIGMGLALLVALAFYLSVILMTELGKHPGAHAEWWIWLPVAACAAIAARIMPKRL